MMKAPVRIYKEYQIVPSAILSDSARNAIEFYFKDFPESIPYVCALECTFLPPKQKRIAPGEPHGIPQQT